VNAAQKAEQSLRTRLMEARAEAAQREEQTVYLRARLQAQHHELHRLQQVTNSTIWLLLI